MAKIYALVIMIIFLFGCKEQEDIEHQIEFEIVGLKNLNSEMLWGWILYEYDDFIFVQMIDKPSFSINISDGSIKEFGGIGEGPGEYPSFPSQIFYNNNHLLAGVPHRGKLIIYDSMYNFIEEKRNYFLMESKIVLLNDSLIVGCGRYFNMCFAVYSINEEEIILKFQDPVEYPGNYKKNELIREGLLYPSDYSWDARDSLLMWYNSYIDKIYVYNIYNGCLDTVFGKHHQGFKTPPVTYFPGDAYQSSSYSVNAIQAVGFAISDDYIFVMLEKIWMVNNKWSLRNFSDEERVSIMKDDFFIVDVYSKSNYEYIGSFYPLNNFLFDKDGFHYFPRIMLANEDNTLIILLQELEEGMKIIELSIKLNI